MQAARDQQVSSALNRRLMLPNFDLGQTLFQSFQTLLDPRTERSRYPAALERLRKYVGREAGYQPITTLAQDRTRERFETTGLTGPWTVEVEQSLSNQPRFIEGIRDLFEKSGLKGWERDFANARETAERSTPNGCARKSCRARARTIACRRRSMPTTC